jgi:uncharacterized protein (UPF0264 family)
MGKRGSDIGKRPTFPVITIGAIFPVVIASITVIAEVTIPLSVTLAVAIIRAPGTIAVAAVIITITAFVFSWRKVAPATTG